MFTFKVFNNVLHNFFHANVVQLYVDRYPLMLSCIYPQPSLCSHVILLSNSHFIIMPTMVDEAMVIITCHVFRVEVHLSLFVLSFFFFGDTLLKLFKMWSNIIWEVLYVMLRFAFVLFMRHSLKYV